MPDESIEILEEELELDVYKKVSVGGWMGTILLSSIPVINLVLWFIWAFGARRASRRTFAAAMLWLTLIFVVLCVAALFVFGGDLLEWCKQLDPNAFKNA